MLQDPMDENDEQANNKSHSYRPQASYLKPIIYCSDVHFHHHTQFIS